MTHASSTRPALSAAGTDTLAATYSAASPLQMVSGDLLDTARMVAVVDTNYFLSNLSLIRALSSRALSRGLVVVVPSVVFQELDGLKLSTKVNMSTQGLKDVSTLARAATRFLDENLGQPGNALRGQKLSEWLRQEQINDDKILDCCLYFIERHKLPVAILSEDRSLNVKARSNGCATCGQWTKDASSLISEIEKLLLGTGRKVATVETNPVPNWSSTQLKARRQHKHQKTVVVAGQTRVIAPLKTGKDPQPRETAADQGTSTKPGDSDSEWEQTGSVRVKMRKVQVNHNQDPQQQQKTNAAPGLVFGTFAGVFTFEMPLDLATSASIPSIASPALTGAGTNGVLAGYAANSKGLSTYHHNGMEVDSDFEELLPVTKPPPHQVTSEPLKSSTPTPAAATATATKSPLPNPRKARPPPLVTVSLPNTPVVPSVSSTTPIPPSSPVSMRTPNPPPKQPLKLSHLQSPVQRSAAVPVTRTSSNGPSVIYIDDVVVKDPKALKTAVDVSADIAIYIRSKSDCSITDMLIDELKKVNLKSAFKPPPWTSTTTILTIILFYRDRLEKSFPGRIFTAIEHCLPWVMQLEGVSTCPFTTAPLPHNLSFAPLPVPADSTLPKDVKRQTEETAKLFSMASRLLAQCLCNENRRQEKKRHEHHKRWDAWHRDNSSSKSRSPSV
ncbi:hypothetical protein LPJ53_005436 [Coemansia erecta]|uniref:PIN domain-containing protein n=1 Tax=Coemansia erecta TaxID=147472 RepID=A0A9W7XXL8_9FUNG|nr:hypothetical protein LPJ53_005436 [Coemansia erecta]